MSAVTFDCPGCGTQATVAAVGGIFVYEGMALKYMLCPTCANIRGKKFEAILDRVERELLMQRPAAGCA